MKNNENTLQMDKPTKYKSFKTGKRISTILCHVLLVFLSIVWLYPILWIVLNAFRTEVNDQGDLIGIVVSHYFPTRVGFDNFTRLFDKYPFWTWFTNTLIVAICTCVLSTILVLSVAYCMSKLRFKFRKPFMKISMILGLFPGFMSMIAIYFIIKALGLTQSLFALILVYSGGAGLGFQIAKGFFDVIPDSLVESARLDGASNARIFGSIILPLSKPIIIYTALMAFTGPWMDFIFAKVIIGQEHPDKMTIAFGLYNIMYGNLPDTNAFTMFCAGCVIVAIPIVTLFILLQKYYVEGVTAGSVKG